MKFLIPIVVGALIGYFTNWLAIKMLFRPHHEKKIRGIRVPFTPGLIPKEKERIGKSIGETVGVYLLSPDTIIESLSGEKTENQIKHWLEDKMFKLGESDKTIKEMVEDIPEENFDEIMQVLKDNIVDIILFQIREDKFKTKISNVFRDKIENLDLNIIYDTLDEKLGLLLLDISESSEFKDGIINFMESKLRELSTEEKNISDIIPIEIIDSLNKYIDENGHKIGNIIRDNFNDPLIQDKLKASIADLVSKNISRLITAFISPDAISEKIFNMIEKYIASEDANKDIVMILESSIERLLESKVSDIFPEIIDSFGTEGLSRIADTIMSYIGDENNRNLLLGLMQEKLKEREVDNKELIIDYLSMKVNFILDSQEMSNTLVLFFDDIIQHLMNKPISFFWGKIDEDMISRIYRSFMVLFNKFIRNELPKILETMDISAIVQEKINSFDVNFTEKLILDIANKELKAITWLGGLLGGIIGVLTPLIQMLY